MSARKNVKPDVMTPNMIVAIAIPAMSPMPPVNDTQPMAAATAASRY
jgi:hypothetical protein